MYMYQGLPLSTRARGYLVRIADTQLSAISLFNLCLIKFNLCRPTVHVSKNFILSDLRWDAHPCDRASEYV